jgi:LmbE family N-acetylglucosaminyl deacetylase
MKEFVAVMGNLGMSEKDYEVFGFGVRHLAEHRQEILDKLVQVRKHFQPDIVIGPSLKDFHQDHNVVANEMVRAFKASSSIICYELPWNHVTFDTQLFVRLGREHISRKTEILNNYESQLIGGKNYLSEDFVYGLARVRGLQCNSEYAEAFEVVRWMI